MKPRCCVAAFWMAAALAMKIASAQGGPEPPVTLQEVLDRVHRHAATQAWEKEGWQDDRIEQWLDKIVGQIAKAAEIPDVKLPVRLSEVKAANVMPGSEVSGALIVGKNVDLKSVSLRNSVVLADGNAELQRATGCVVVARGAVVAETAHYCVFAAGAYVKISVSDGALTDTANGSVILSRGWADVGRAYGSIILAHEGTSLENARDALFINAAFVGANERGGNRSLRIRRLPLEELPERPFAAPLHVLGLVRPDVTIVDTRLARFAPTPLQPAAPLGIVLRYGDRRYFAAAGQPIVDQDGKEIEALRGWQVSFVDDQVAIFSSDTADVPVRLEGR